MNSAVDCISRTLPVPWHLGQAPLTDSPILGLSLCLESSSNPNLEILPI